MDDAWFHTLTSTHAVTEKKSAHKRRPSLLQQPTEAKDNVTVDPIAEAFEGALALDDGEDASLGPPKASVSRRAQSYSDFYHAVRAYTKQEKAAGRRKSIGQGGMLLPSASDNSELTFEAEGYVLEDDLLTASHATYQTYQEQLEMYESHLDILLHSTADTLGILSSLSSSFRAVEAQTEAFRQQCESLVDEQRRLTTIADAIDENAQYYAYLEPMTRRLNAPGAANLVKGKDFPEMLSNLDNCIVYMETHPQHHESATYRSRYRLLLTRGLTLVRHHITKVLGETAADISKRISSGQLKDTTHSALLYAKFRVPAPESKALGVEIQKRAVPTPEDADAGREPEYLSLLNELYQSYASARGRLILPIVAKKMSDLALTPNQLDLITFAKSAITFVRGICLDEHDLWYEWFETEGALYDFLESIAEPMYDHLRPKTIHETKLEKLCDLCAMIQGRYMDLDSDDEDDAVSTFITPSNQSRKLDFASLVQPALEDAQTRLVFLAMNALRDGIEYYKPKPEDLEFNDQPAANGTNGTAKKGPVLSGKRDPTNPPLTPAPKTPTVADDVGDGESIFSKQFAADEKSPAGRRYYPTLRKAVWLLRRIYRLVNSTVFDDLAHRIVHSTISSLRNASQQVASRKSKEDGQLFLIVHLLHLKQQIVAFDIEFIPPEVEFDFSSMTNTFYELRERGSLWNPASWVRLVGGAVGGGLLPKVVENMLDAKAELDGRLRTVINDFVNGYASHITAPLDPAALAPPAKKPPPGKDDSGFDALKAIRTMRGLAEKDVPALRAKLDEYVDDARTRETLVAAVRDQVVLAYEDFFDIYSEGSGKRVSRKGKAREDEIWGPNLFRDAMDKIFLVGQTMADPDDSDDSGALSD